MLDSRPVLLDLFCGAGGAAVGYNRAGFRVIGVDTVDQPHYPYEFYRHDALTFPIEGFDAVHASPPCQRYSAMNNGAWRASAHHPDLIAATRARLQASGLPYVIENVPGAPLVNPVMLCGSMFGLSADGFYLQRHRLFESNVPITGTRWCNHAGRAMSVVGHGRSGGEMRGRTANAAQARELMGIDWCNRDGIAQAIPPAYTEWIGRQLLGVLV